MIKKVGPINLHNGTINMTVSAIIPTFNSEKYICEALDSVYGQTRTLHEIICVDDASIDATVSLIKSNYPGVRIVQNEKNEGPAYSRNKGISIASGDVIAFSDADDYWVSEKTHWQLSLLEANHTLDIVGGLAEYFNMPDSVHQKKETLLNKPHYNAYLQTFLIKKEVFQKIGMFNERLRLSEDHDWFLRARESGIKIKIIEKTVTMIRVHDGNSTRELTFRDSGLMEVLKMSLDRRRQSGTLRNLRSISPDET